MFDTIISIKTTIAGIISNCHMSNKCCVSLERKSYTTFVFLLSNCSQVLNIF